MTRTTSHFSRACIISSAERPRCTARRLFRLRQQDFTAHRTADGMTPDWPIRYEDLEPYYTAGRTALQRPRPARR